MAIPRACLDDTRKRLKVATYVGSVPARRGGLDLALQRKIR